MTEIDAFYWNNGNTKKTRKCGKEKTLKTLFKNPL